NARTPRWGRARPRSAGERAPSAVRRPSVMMVRVAAAHRAKDALTRVGVQVLALAELPERRVVHHADAALRDLDREVEIADGPAEARGGGGIVPQGQLEHRLGLLGDAVIGALRLREDVAV